MRTAVITIVRGRAEHLRRQLAGLSAGRRRPDLHLVVAMGDPSVRDTVAGALRTRVLHCATTQGPLPLARARNLGARAALADGAELLIFLDVDCVPSPQLIDRYAEVAAAPAHAGTLLCGTVAYLPPPGPGGYPPDDLAGLAAPHPARPAPGPDEVLTGTDHRLFWSLSFATTAATWNRIGGFCERYRGYGGEDTDFGQTAAASGVPLRWVGGAAAFHQHHPVSDPPVEHIDDILGNAAIFEQRWGWWPMAGWLQAFEERGLIRRDADGRPHRTGAGAEIAR